MPDVQIFSGKDVPVPSVYTLPDSAEFTLKAVTAEYADDGAVVDWLPCVTIVSDSGHVIARAVDQAVKVTAGDDAEVSWFPGVKHFAATTPSGSGAPDWIHMFGVVQVIPATAGGFSGETTWDHSNYQTSGTGIWTFTLDGGGNIVEVLASSHGIYESWCSFHLDAPSKSVAETVVANIFGTIPALRQQSNVASITTTTIFEGMVGAGTFFTSGSAIFNMQIDFSNNASGSFQGVEWWIKHWPL